jgi:hypothetical protein
MTELGSFDHLSECCGKDSLEWIASLAEVPLSIGGSLTLCLLKDLLILMF